MRETDRLKLTAQDVQAMLKAAEGGDAAAKGFLLAFLTSLEAITPELKERNPAFRETLAAIERGDHKWRYFPNPNRKEKPAHA